MGFLSSEKGQSMMRLMAFMVCCCGVIVLMTGVVLFVWMSTSYDINGNAIALLLEKDAEHDIKQLAQTLRVRVVSAGDVVAYMGIGTTLCGLALGLKYAQKRIEGQGK